MSNLVEVIKIIMSKGTDVVAKETKVTSKEMIVTSKKVKRI